MEARAGVGRGGQRDSRVTDEQKEAFKEARPFIVLAIAALFASRPGPFYPEVDIQQANRFVDAFEKSEGI